MMTAAMFQKPMAMAAAVLMAVFVSMLMYLVFFEPPWLSYTNEPFPVLNSPVKGGDPVQMVVERCSEAKVTRIYAVSRTLVGSHTSIILPASLAAIDPGCTSVVSAVNVVPIGTPPGTYTLRGYGEIQGIVRTSSIRWVSQPFEVAP